MAEDFPDPNLYVTPTPTFRGIFYWYHIKMINFRNWNLVLCCQLSPHIILICLFTSSCRVCSMTLFFLLAAHLKFVEESGYLHYICQENHFFRKNYLNGHVDLHFVLLYAICINLEYICIDLMLLFVIINWNVIQLLLNMTFKSLSRIVSIQETLHKSTSCHEWRFDYNITSFTISFIEGAYVFNNIVLMFSQLWQP